MAENEEHFHNAVALELHGLSKKRRGCEWQTINFLLRALKAVPVKPLLRLVY